MKKEALSGWAGKSAKKANYAAAAKKAETATRNATNATSHGQAESAHREAAKAASAAGLHADAAQHGFQAEHHQSKAQSGAAPATKATTVRWNAPHVDAISTPTPQSQKEAAAWDKAMKDAAAHKEKTAKLEAAAHRASTVAAIATNSANYGGVAGRFMSGYPEAQKAHTHADAAKAQAAASEHQQRLADHIRVTNPSGAREAQAKAEQHALNRDRHEAEHKASGGGGDDMPRDEQGRFAPK